MNNSASKENKIVFLFKQNPKKLYLALVLYSLHSWILFLNQKLAFSVKFKLFCSKGILDKMSVLCSICTDSLYICTEGERIFIHSCTDI